MIRECIKHGISDFRKRSGTHGWQCRKCGIEAVKRRRHKVKEILVQEAGGKCSACGYSRCMRALEFHHLDPTTKQFGIAAKGATRSIESLREEVRKCVLLCSNCHAEAEENSNQA